MIHVMLVDDHAVVRAGYRRLLELHPGLLVVAEAPDGAAALQRWREGGIDVGVIDLALDAAGDGAGLGGLELIGRILQRDNHARLLAFSMHQDPVWATNALKAGALGFVTKSSPPETLVDAVRTVAQGRRFVSQDVSGAVTNQLLHSNDEAPLSPREFDVLRALVAGQRPQEVAQSLHLSVKTVHNLHYQIKSKLGTATDFELARLALRRGWVR